MRLINFNDKPNTDIFNPPPLHVLVHVHVHVDRPSGQEWLNGALIWVTNEQLDLLYFFPRECSRIGIWPFSRTAEDWHKWSGDYSKALSHSLNNSRRDTLILFLSIVMNYLSFYSKKWAK